MDKLHELIKGADKGITKYGYRTSSKQSESKDRFDIKATSEIQKIEICREGKLIEIISLNPQADADEYYFECQDKWLVKELTPFIINKCDYSYYKISINALSGDYQSELHRLVSVIRDIMPGQIINFETDTYDPLVINCKQGIDNYSAFKIVNSRVEVIYHISIPGKQIRITNQGIDKGGIFINYATPLFTTNRHYGYRKWLIDYIKEYHISTKMVDLTETITADPWIFLTSQAKSARK